MEVSDKDIYEYIVNLAEDRDVINMLSVNKKFNDDSYFKKILEKRYPLLLQFKSKYETYRQFYLGMVKYMAKLWEEYDIPYIPAKDFDPRFFYKIAKHYLNIYNLSLQYALEAEDENLIEYFVEKGGEITAGTYHYLGRHGSVDILKFLLSKFPPSYIWLQETLIIAEKNGNLPVAEFLLNGGIKV